MQRIVCPDTESWTMVERLISVDVERLGNVQWWSLVSQYTSDQSVRTMRYEEETRGCCAVFMWDITRDLVLRISSRQMCEERNENCQNNGTREMGSRVQCNVCWSSLAVETGQRNLVRPVVPEAEAEQGVAPVIVMPAVPRVDRRRYVTKRDLVKYGYTDECQACTQLASGMLNAKVPHDDRCRDRIGELMAGDDDQRQVERVSGSVHSEVEIPRLEAGKEVDVGEPTVRVAGTETPSVPRTVEEQPVPTVRVCGSSGSGTRSGVGSRASEKNTDDREVKRVRVAESRGKKKQGEDVEELAAKAEEQHLDADVEVPAHKTWRVEDVVGDAADAAPEQMNILLCAAEQCMNSLTSSKTEVFEKIEESLRPLCMVEDLNDDEVMELCILSNELNACEITAVLNPSKFASIGTRFELREGSQWI